MKIGAVSVITFVIFVCGIMFHNLVLIDSSFALAYYTLDFFGLWRHGPMWVMENRFLSIFCFIIFPVLVSVLLANLIVVFFSRLAKQSIPLAISFVFVVLILFFGLQSPSDKRISFFSYWASNY